jgi:hypothetical protein
MRFVEVSKIDMKFDCDGIEYEFYKKYAYQIGFSIRKQFVKRANSRLFKGEHFAA